jgi:hypothetical protein
MKPLALALALFTASANAYHGYIDPIPFRSVATIRFVDTPVPNIECAARAHPLLAPIAATSMMGCVNETLDEVVASITPSPFWVVIVGHGLTTPQSVIGHEFLHIYYGLWHGALPWINRLRYTDEDRRALLDNQHGAEVFLERRGSENYVRLSSENRQIECTIFTRDKAVSYHDIGVLVQECLK